MGAFPHCVLAPKQGWILIAASPHYVLLLAPLKWIDCGRCLSPLCAIASTYKGMDFDRISHLVVVFGVLLRRMRLDHEEVSGTSKTEAHL